MRKLMFIIFLFCMLTTPALAQLEQDARYPHCPTGGGYKCTIFVTSAMPPGTTSTLTTVFVKNPAGGVVALTSYPMLPGDSFSYELPGASDSGTASNYVLVHSDGRFTSYGVIATAGFDLAINSEIERASFKIAIDVKEEQVTIGNKVYTAQIDAGLAIANFQKGPRQVDAYLKDLSTKDSNGQPVTLGTTSFTLQEAEKTAKFSSQMFPILVGKSFHGEIWFAVSDPTSQELTPKVTPWGLRTKGVPDVLFSFSPVSVTSLPPGSIAEITSQQFRLVYFCELDQCQNKIAGYEEVFPQSVGIVQTLTAIENERGGYGYKTFEFSPVVIPITGSKSLSAYPTDGRLRAAAVVAEVNAQMGPGPKFIIGGNNLYASEGFSIGAITYPDKLISNMKGMIALLKSGRTSVDTGEILFAAAGIFGLTHEVGHQDGADHLDDPAIDQSLFRTQFRGIMVVSSSSEIGWFSTWRPKIKLTNLAKKDIRFTAFSAGSLKKMNTGQSSQCPTGTSCLMQLREQQ